MSKSQKVLRVFGILEIVAAVLCAVGAIQGGGAMLWLSVVSSAISAYLLLVAAKDASKISGAWWILLFDLVLSVAEVFFALDGGTSAIVSAGIAVVLNLIAFIAANNVKKQARR